MEYAALDKSKKRTTPVMEYAKVDMSKKRVSQEEHKRTSEYDDTMVEKKESKASIYESALNYANTWIAYVYMCMRL